MKEDDIMGVVEGTAKSKTTGSATRKVGAIAAVLALGVMVAAPFRILKDITAHRRTWGT